MRKISLTAALAAVTLSTAAMAEEWVIVAEDAKGNMLTVDSTSIRTMPNGHKRAWSMNFYPNGLITSEGPDRSVSLEEYDCREEKSRSLQSTFFKEEEVVEVNSAPTNWQYASPRSLHEAQFNYVCFGKLPE